MEMVDSSQCMTRTPSFKVCDLARLPSSYPFPRGQPALSYPTRVAVAQRRSNFVVCMLSPRGSTKRLGPFMRSDGHLLHAFQTRMRRAHQVPSGNPGKMERRLRADVKMCNLDAAFPSGVGRQ